jgi:Xaa-Pro aminopeptidase
MNINERLAALRKEMKSHNISAYIIPSSDPHQSEYVADHWTSRAWISGFTGSAGTAIVTMDHAGVWTDSRYFLQAGQELDSSEFELHKVYNQGEPDFIDWLCANLKSGSVVACDGLMISKHQYNQYKASLNAESMKLDASLDLISHIWEDRPALPKDKAFSLDVKYAGQNRQSKIDAIRDLLKAQNVSNHLVSTLDDIAWILNIRGSDVTFNPVVISYLLITEKQVIWFVDEGKVSKQLKSELGEDNIQIQPYDALIGYLNSLEENAGIYVDPGTLSIGMYKAINAQNIRQGELFSRAMKAVKNDVEQKHYKTAMRKDGVALVKFYNWFLDELAARSVSEFEIVEKLAYFRSQQKGYHGESFGAIVGYKGNGAIIHYSPKPETSAQIKQSGLLLIDSGGQYNEGTTDITRTFTLGNTTDEEKEAYTLVLKGHVALSRAKFPKGTKGVQLDILARLPLWETGKNYLHGTGHGVGFFLNVHEPPQGFTAGLSSRGNTTIVPGMVTSNEPGFYKQGAYGIRIENLIVSREAELSDFGAFYDFETITLFPYEPDLIVLDLLSAQEIAWINEYHEMVWNELSPYLSEKESEWLKNKCKKLDH